MIRCVTEADIPWLHDLCRQAYPSGYYDSSAAEAVVRSWLTARHCLLLRGKQAWLGVTLVAPWWQPTLLEARLLPIASHGKGSRELLAMNRRAIDWAREKGAQRFYWSAVTGADLGPLARAFGAVPSSPSYVLDLRDVR